MTTFATPRLFADIGGLYARFAIETEKGVLSRQASLRCSDYQGIEDVVRAYMGSIASLQIKHAAITVANPVDGDRVRMTNYHWQFSIEEMRRSLDLETLVVVNDFTALAMALPKLGPDDLRQIGDGQSLRKNVMGLLGSGTGLGVSGLIPSGDDWISLGSEGGHTSFSPRDALEIKVLEFAMNQFDHVSFERLLSASGLELIHQALHADESRTETTSLSAPDITQRALEERDEDCIQTLNVFCNIFGTAASNLAVTLGALGGIFVGGSIIPRLGDFFIQSDFRKRFEDKGRFGRYVQNIPTYVITAQDATFRGLSAILEQQLKTLRASGGSAILSQIRRLRTQLSPAEQRVADLVLSQPRSVLNDPIHDIAVAAEVSQPTVIRFCRSVGCKGLSDFKLRLASGPSVSVPIMHSQVTQEDSILEIGAKVLGNTANAVLQLRNELQRDEIDSATELISNAKRVEIFAVGSYSSIAYDAQMKFLRLGLPCSAHTDPHLQALAADVIEIGTVAVFVSSGGNLPELLSLAQKVRERGGKVIAVTANQSTLAKRADASMVAEHNEQASTHLPMISRVLHLLLLDILVVSLEMRRTKGTAALALGAPKSPLITPGILMASPLRPAISHKQ